MGKNLWRREFNTELRLANDEETVAQLSETNSDPWNFEMQRLFNTNYGIL